MNKLLKALVMLVCIIMVTTESFPMMLKYWNTFNRVSTGLRTVTNANSRQFSSFDSLKKLLRIETPDKIQTEQKTKEKISIKKNLANGMDMFVLGTLAALKSTYVNAKLPGQKYIADIAGLEIAEKCRCNLLNEKFHTVEPKTEKLPRWFLFFDCKSLVQNHNPKNLVDITEQITNCPPCMENFLKKLQIIENAGITSKNNNLEQVVKLLDNDKETLD